MNGVLQAESSMTLLGSVMVLLMLRRFRRTLEASLVLLLAFTALMFYHGALAIQLLG